MKRHILTKLAAWQHQKKRKPLLLMGVRQCGKTTSLREFGKQQFPQTHYFNFEKQQKLQAVFESDLDPLKIIEELNFHTISPINIEHDLIIFDEIQACPRALTSLKYFNEDLSQLALCAAGSLLGIHLNGASFPVGMVDQLHMYPMNFQEFLLALGEQRSIDAIQKAQETYQMGTTVHQHLWNLLKQYFITGGLPEVISEYIEHREVLVEALQAVRAKQSTLIKNYFADIAKHAGKVNAMHIARLWQAIPEQLTKVQDNSSAKFRFKGILPSVSRYDRLASAIDWLHSAHHIIRTPIVEHVEIPLSAYTKDNRFKLFMFDIGILGALAGIAPKTILDYDYGTYKGYFAENFVVQELQAAGLENIYNWQQGKAEVEFICDRDGDIIPIEVKSGSVTQAKSLEIFNKKYQPKRRVIFSARNIQLQQSGTLRMLPLYLAGCLSLLD